MAVVRELPEGLLALENILVALLALLGTVADGVCLLIVCQSRLILVWKKNVLP